MSFFSADDISAPLWAPLWGWAMDNNPLIIVALLTVVLVLPVVFLATKTIARAFCQDNNVLPVAVPHHGTIANTFQGVAPSTVALRSAVRVLEERLAVSPVSPPPNISQMTFPNVQPPPGPSELRMLRKLKATYILLDQTLDGATNSLSAVERMDAACSVVSRAVANLETWRAPAAVVALLQPAKDVTDLFSRRSKKNGSSAMGKGRQEHCVALLKKRAQTMQEVLSQASWAGTMPTVPMKIGDAVHVITLAETLGTIGHKTSSATRKIGSKGKSAIPQGVQHVSYPVSFQLADIGVVQ